MSTTATTAKNMITFSCTGCGREFNVPENFAGRKAKCKSCGTSVTVPQADAPVDIAPPEPVPPVPKLPMRTRRLMADAKLMSDSFAKSSIIRVRPVAGDPPETYQVDYHIKSLDHGKNGQPIGRDRHTVEIQLTSDYPRMSPKCKMLTPVFHPNIDPATICVGDHWTAGERLADLVVRIGEMLAYQAYNIKSPLDGEAAMWADLNGDKLPTDSRSIRPAEME